MTASNDAAGGDEDDVERAAGHSPQAERDALLVRIERTPLTEAVIGHVRDLVGSGRYGPGSRLPGENDLMATYQVARETARKAVAQLINEGIATPRRGAGVYVRDFRPVIRDGIARLSGAGFIDSGFHAMSWQRL